MPGLSPAASRGVDRRFDPLVPLVLCTVARLYVKPFPDSVWMPRYLGFVGPRSRSQSQRFL
jgi:hypothetical protein